MANRRSLPTEDDPDLEAELTRALEPYQLLLPPEMLAVFRETLSDALTTHPVGSLLFERARPRNIQQVSEDREKPGSASAPADEELKPKQGGRRS
jgi:hypothetical protein